MNYWNFSTEIKNSKIHGQGRFTLVDIPTDEVVLIVMGSIKPCLPNNNKLIIKGTKFVLDCDQTYVNHSKDANLYLDGQIVFRSKRNIVAGEELTIDYYTLINGKLPFEENINI